MEINIPAPAVFVDLSFNLLENVPANYFVNLPSLDHLDLYSNQIEIIEDRSFQYLSNLSICHLHNNKLKEVTRYMFSGLSNLRKLSLYGNNIKSIQGGSFFDLVKLTRLQIQNNLLQIISEWIFDPVNHPQHLMDFNIMNNHLWCTCNMTWIKEAEGNWLQVTHKSETFCHGPGEYCGTLWSEWPRENTTCIMTGM